MAKKGNFFLDCENGNPTGIWQVMYRWFQAIDYSFFTPPAPCPPSSSTTATASVLENFKSDYAGQLIVVPFVFL